jgi:hypothetical protein
VVCRQYTRAWRKSRCGLRQTAARDTLRHTCGELRGPPLAHRRYTSAGLLPACEKGDSVSNHRASLGAIRHGPLAGTGRFPARTAVSVHRPSNGASVPRLIGPLHSSRASWAILDGEFDERVTVLMCPVAHNAPTKAWTCCPPRVTHVVPESCPKEARHEHGPRAARPGHTHSRSH